MDTLRPFAADAAVTPAQNGEQDDAPSRGGAWLMGLTGALIFVLVGGGALLLQKRNVPHASAAAAAAPPAAMTVAAPALTGVPIGVPASEQTPPVANGVTATGSTEASAAPEPTAASETDGKDAKDAKKKKITIKRHHAAAPAPAPITKKASQSQAAAPAAPAPPPPAANTPQPTAKPAAAPNKAAEATLLKALAEQGLN